MGYGACTYSLPIRWLLGSILTLALPGLLTSEQILATASAQPIPEHWVNQRIAFADGSFESGDYTTATREYRWLLRQGAMSADSLHWMLARCSFRLDADSEASAHLLAISEHGSYFDYRMLGHMWLLFSLNPDSDARPFISDFAPRIAEASDEVYDPFWVLTLADAADRRLWQALDSLKADRPLADPLARLASNRIYELAENFRYRKPKSPDWAAALGLIPGGGQAYLGRWAQATVVFLAVSGLAMQSREGFRRGSDTFAYGFLGLSTGIWALSIHNGAVQAREYNRAADANYAQRLRSEAAAVVRPALAR